MADVNWEGVSCCGDHRSGVIAFEDGETIYVTELNGGEKYALSSVKENADFVESVRLAGGTAYDLTKEQFEAWLAGL